MSRLPVDRRQDLRDRILDATLEVIRERGVARTRTSAIAQAAGCAEGSIYRYFSGKPQLLREVVRTRLPDLAQVLAPPVAGTGTVAGNLRAVADAAARYFRDVAPLLGDHALVTRADLGAQGAAAALARYLQEEQQLGRARADADADSFARVLLATCLGAAFCCRGDGDVHAVAALVARDLEPR